jgi:hypothetical protein
MADFGIGSDYKTIITFLADGHPISASGVGMPSEFTLDFYTTSTATKKTASLYDGVYDNCSFVSEEGVVKLVCAFDNVVWAEGDVTCVATMTFNDDVFPDGQRTVVKYIETGDSYGTL